jgi:hypothetical protein
MQGTIVNWKAEILNLGEGEKKGSFFLTLMGQIRNGFKVLYTETRSYEIDLKVLEQTFGTTDSFVGHSTDTLQKQLELLIKQKFKALKNAR